MTDTSYLQCEISYHITKLPFRITIIGTAYIHHNSLTQEVAMNGLLAILILVFIISSGELAIGQTIENGDKPSKLFIVQKNEQFMGKVSLVENKYFDGIRLADLVSARDFILGSLTVNSIVSSS